MMLLFGSLVAVAAAAFRQSVTLAVAGCWAAATVSLPLLLLLLPFAVPLLVPPPPPPAESSLCHLELACNVVLICAHRSFLHDLELFGGGNERRI